MSAARRVRVGPAVVLAAVVAGIALGGRAGPGSAGGWVVVAVVGSVAAAAAVAADRATLALGLCCGAALVAGAAAMMRATDGLHRGDLVGAIEARASATGWATLVADPVATRFHARVLARVDAVRLDPGGAVAGGRIVVVDASGEAAPRLGVLEAGDRVRLRGYLRPLAEPEAWLRWRHAAGAFAATEVLAHGPARSPLLHVANDARARVLAGHAGVPEPQRALLAGFLVGDTSDLPPAVVADFRAAGLTHLVAVSGQNVAFVLALAGPVVSRGPRWVRLVVGVALLVVFAAMTRWEPSVLRACTMAACAMTAMALGRPASGLRTLALAVTGLLLVDPFLYHSVGFRLSCAACVGIAALGPAIAARVPGPRAFADAVGVSVGAQVAVAPVLVAVFGTVPLVAVPANLLVAPFAGPLTMLGFVGGLAGGVAGPVVGAIASFPAYVCASVVLLVARVAARVPVAVGAGPALVALGALAVTFAWRSAGRATWRRARPRPPRSRLAVPPR